jgi:hypothetical protein
MTPLAPAAAAMLAISFLERSTSTGTTVAPPMITPK